jgi:hypothetical protein
MASSPTRPNDHAAGPPEPDDRVYGTAIRRWWKSVLAGPGGQHLRLSARSAPSRAR